MLPGYWVSSISISISNLLVSLILFQIHQPLVMQILFAHLTLRYLKLSDSEFELMCFLPLPRCFCSSRSSGTIEAMAWCLKKGILSYLSLPSLSRPTYPLDLSPRHFWNPSLSLHSSSSELQTWSQMLIASWLFSYPSNWTVAC